MPDFSLSNLSEAPSRNTATESLRLSITFSEIDSVKVILIIQTGFDEGFDSAKRTRD